MLETTLAAGYDPASNLKGDVTGANWSFLLPTLELKQIVCIGAPMPSTLAVLSRIGQRVIVVARTAGQLQRINLPNKERDGLNVSLVLADWEKALPFSQDAADLVFVADRDAAREVNRVGPLVPRLRRLLRPEGLIYFEFDGRAKGLLRPQASAKVAECSDFQQVYWLTPGLGEAQTAVPVMDRETTAHFLNRRLFSLTFKPETLWRFGSDPLRKYGTATNAKHELQGKKTVCHESLKVVQDCGRRVAKGLFSGLVHRLGNLESWLVRKRILARVAPRYGAFLGCSEAHLGTMPPQYLVSLAQSSGMDIRNHRWGLCAKGEYSSRKVLFFLFDRLAKEPQYVVKMTREPKFNSRLENEYQALSLLESQGIGSQETLPRVAFFGHHGGVAIVGETAIRGEPFRDRTTWREDCPYALSAIDWLVNLGASTAEARETVASEMAEALHSLLRRFVEIYRPTQPHHDFLCCQIQRIADSRGQIPVVFQHGDPGTWNVMASESGHAVFLDWEAAEQHGMPLWDLFYFLRSYCVSATRQRGVRDSLNACARHFLGKSPLSALVIRSTLEYCQRSGLPNDLVEPLFYTCWVHRALKEANRLERAKLGAGHYVSLLRLCIEERNAPTLRRLFSPATKLEPIPSSLSAVNQA